MNNHVLGVDFGTSAVRALILNAEDGSEVAAGVSGYPRWEKGEFCDPANSVYRQHPLELREAFTAAVSEAVSKLPPTERAKVAAISVDTTGSSPLPVDSHLQPLAASPEFGNDPNAMCILWKDHAAIPEASLISQLIPPEYLQFCGNEYSAEWFWAKLLHVAKRSPKIGAAAATWVEHCDWVVADLCGHSNPAQLVRSRCGAAHKALWNTRWGGFPDAAVLAQIDPYLGHVRRNLSSETMPAGQAAGELSANWAEMLGLPAGIPVGAAIFDAHAGAIGAGVAVGRVVKVIGTSSAEIVVAEPDRLPMSGVPGIESQAEGSIVPDMIGIEAGQPAFGDIFAWYARLLSYSATGEHGEPDPTTINRVLSSLEEAAGSRPLTSHTPVVLDWFNGRRAPYANSGATGALTGLDLGMDAVDLYSSIVRSLGFGTKAIHAHLRSQGVPIHTVTAVGGIPQRSPYIMQTLANCIACPVEVAGTTQASARGSAILATVVAGLYPNVAAAIEKLRSKAVATYSPSPDSADTYEAWYRDYITTASTLDTTARFT